MASGGKYGYDAQNRLVSATVNGNSILFNYDGKNRCVSRTVNGTTVYLVYDGWNLIEEWNGQGVELNRYVHGARVDELISKTPVTGQPIYYQQDGLGSTASLTDTTGKILEKYTFDIFGNTTIKDGNGQTLTTSAFGNRFLFTGREFLSEVNLYDYRNRVYSADLGRFLQTDPFRFDAGDVENTYSYVGNDPTNWIDPDGLGPQRSGRSESGQRTTTGQSKADQKADGTRRSNADPSGKQNRDANTNDDDNPPPPSQSGGLPDGQLPQPPPGQPYPPPKDSDAPRPRPPSMMPKPPPKIILILIFGACGAIIGYTLLVLVL